MVVNLHSQGRVHVVHGHLTVNVSRVLLYNNVMQYQLSMYRTDCPNMF